MKRTQIKDLKPNTKVLIKGFLQETRVLSKVVFLIVRDVTGLLQCVVKEDSKFFDLAKKVNKESVLAISGSVKANKQAMKGLEIIVDSIEVINEADTPLPIPIVEKGVETGLSKRLDWRYLDLRKKRNLLIMKVLHSLEKGMRDYWYNNGFIEIHSPKFMGSPSESGSELFMVPYFGKEAFLAQSPQFYKQMAMAAGFERVFEIGPVFRANPSHTTRHDTEYTSIDMEISFIKDHHDVMDAEAEWLAHAFKIIKEECGNEIKEVFGFDLKVPKLPFPKVTMEEAYKIIESMGGKCERGEDIEPEHERMLCKWVKEKHKHDFIFIYDWPWKVRPFYHMKTEDGTKTKSFDLLYKGIEITSGAQREHRYEVLKKQVEEKGVVMNKGMKDYINFFKYGCPPHGGLGLSSTRVVMRMLDLDNVRESTYLPRDTERLTP
jgi:aspartyl-tRNA synthetase